MKAPRNIVVKACLSADHYLDLLKDCAAAGKSQSSLLRDSWLACRNGKPASRASVRARPGQFLAKFAPGRTTRPTAHMRS